MYIDRFHFGGHALTCSEAFSLAHTLDAALKRLNTSVSEQVNSVIARHAESLRQMSVQHAVLYMKHIAAWKNQQVMQAVQELVAQESRGRAAV